jgi:hypothetical protein
MLGANPRTSRALLLGAVMRAWHASSVAPGEARRLFPSLSLDDPFTLLLVVLATLGVVGYLIGRAVNKRRARSISAWLEPGLRTLGGTPGVQAVNRTAFRVKVTQARPPFAVVTATVVLISREALPIWLWERLHGHTDVLALHLTLRRPPTVEADLLDLGSDLGRRGETQVRALEWADVGGRGMHRLFHASTTHPADLDALIAQVDTGRHVPWRLAVRRNAPHVLISLAVPDFRRESSTEMVRWLTKLVKSIPTERGDGGK